MREKERGELRSGEAAAARRRLRGGGGGGGGGGVCLFFVFFLALTKQKENRERVSPQKSGNLFIKIQ